MNFFDIWKLERKKNEEIKGRISKESGCLSYNTTNDSQHLYKLENPRGNSSWEISDTNFPMYYIGVKDGKKEKEG